MKTWLKTPSKSYINKHIEEWQEMFIKPVAKQITILEYNITLYSTSSYRYKKLVRMIERLQETFEKDEYIMYDDMVNDDNIEEYEEHEKNEDIEDKYISFCNEQYFEDEDDEDYY